MMLPAAIRQVLPGIMIISIEFSLGASQTSVNSIQELAMAYLADNTPRNGTEYQRVQWMWSFAVTMELLFAVISGSIFNLVADRYGRRMTIFFAGIPFSISFIIQYLMYPLKSIYPFIFGRLLMGLLYPTLYYAVTVFMVETVPKEKRGKITLFYGAFFVLGLSSEQILGLPQLLYRPNLWPVLLLLVTGFLIPGLLVAPAVHETPCYLQLRQFTSERVRKSSDYYLCSADESASEQEFSLQIVPMSLCDFLRDSTFRFHKLIIIAYAGCVSFGANIVFVCYMTDFMVQFGIPGNPARTASALIITAAVLVSFGLSMIIDKQGRRCALAFLLTTNAMLLASMIWLKRLGNTSALVEGLFIANIAVCFTANVLLHNMSFIVGEILPTKARASGYALFIMALNGTGAFTTQFFDVLEQARPGYGIFMILLPFVICSIILLTFLPETAKLNAVDADHNVRSKGEQMIASILSCKMCVKDK